MRFGGTVKLKKKVGRCIEYATKYPLDATTNTDITMETKFNTEARPSICHHQQRLTLMASVCHHQQRLTLMAQYLSPPTTLNPNGPVSVTTNNA